MSSWREVLIIRILALLQRKTLIETGLLIFRGKKKQNFAGFSGANSGKNQPISREKSQNSQENRPTLRDFS